MCRKTLVTLAISMVVAHHADAWQIDKNAAKKIAEGKQPTAADVLAKLKQVSLSNTATALNACSWLKARTTSDMELKAKVALRLMDVAENGDALMSGAAAQALPNWPTEEIAPRLLTMVRGNTNRQGPMLALGKLKYEKAIPTLVRYIDSGEDRDTARKALILMGPAAEPALLKYINDNIDLKKEIRFGKATGGVREAMQILIHVGTKESLKTLELIKTRAADRAYSTLAANAIDAIIERVEATKK